MGGVERLGSLSSWDLISRDGKEMEIGEDLVFGRVMSWVGGCLDIVWRWWIFAVLFVQEIWVGALVLLSVENNIFSKP